MNHRSQNESNEEQRELDRRFREKDPETQRCHLDDSRKQRAHCEFDTFSRRNEEELRWGKGGPPDRGKKGSQDSGNAVEAAERPGKEQRSEGGPAAKTERPGNKVLLLVWDHLSFISRKSTNSTSAALCLLYQTEVVLVSPKREICVGVGDLGSRTLPVGSLPPLGPVLLGSALP